MYLILYPHTHTHKQTHRHTYEYIRTRDAAVLTERALIIEPTP